MKSKCLSYDIMVVGYYTDDKLYRGQWQNLKKDLDKYGFRYDFECIKSQGTWQKNTQFMTSFISKKLKQYSGQPLLYLDVDERIVREPVLFSKPLPCDIAARVVNWKNYSKSPRQNTELCSAVVYFLNTFECKDTVEEWIEECKRYPNVWDQRCLRSVIKRRKHIRFYDLPDTYSCIFDLMQECKSPVILSMQASRQVQNKNHC